MVRQRKPGAAPQKLQFADTNSNETSSSSGNSDSSDSKKAFGVLSSWKTLVGLVCLMIAVYIGSLGYLETRVNTPFVDKKVVQETGLAVPDRYWGSYRPGVYFGMKTREPRSPVFGLMWYDLNSVPHKGIRHWCEQSDNLPTYGWERHDGVTFGEQLISDPPHTIVTSFVKTPGDHGGHWTARINVTAEGNAGPFMLIWYGALDESTGGPPTPAARMWMEGGTILGHDAQLHSFRVNLHTHQGRIIQKAYSEAHAPGLHLLKEKFYSLLKVQKHQNLGRVAMVAPDEELSGINLDKDVNFIPIQMLVETPFVLDVVYTTDDISPPLRGDEYTKLLQEKRNTFDQQFENKFGLKEKGYSADDVSAARAALASLVGGVGHFYGAGRVRSQYTREPVPYWRAALYTAVPSRSFFPRGFLWDEGFHAALIGRWNLDIEMDIAAHWMDLINVEGWIPREQILGSEALARVPKEFVVQNNAAANPPMLLITLARLIQIRPQMFGVNSPHRRTLDRMFTRLQAWYQWFQNTQRGDEPTTYRWRGREDDGIQLNPKSLSSGLDDYPRASHPSSIERHLDLRCWMFAAADAMAVIARVVNRESTKFEAMRDQLGDERLLNELHWSPTSETYADYGLHTDSIRLVRTKPKHQNDPPRMVRKVVVQPEPRLVTSAFGYVSLFPMLLKVLSPESENLGKIFEKLDKPDLLWSSYGLRSLSKSSPLYMKRNTEHDPPYWRGAVWVNLNYLALSSLKHYANAPGPYADRAREMHSKLRENIVGNILSEYKRTGAFWEQYSGEDGRGSGCRPFTGWTALLTLIMADEY